MRDFRRLEPMAGPAWTPRLHAEYKRALSQREVMLELAEVSPASVPTAVDLPAIRVDEDPERAANRLRSTLGLDAFESDWANPRDALRAGIHSAEQLGVLVVQTQRIRSSEMQGFSVAQWPFPVVALNGGDAERRRLFTLMHELGHLAVRAGGLCDLHEESEDPERAEDRIELFCNQVAASALMPAAWLLATPVVADARPGHGWTLDELRQISRRFGPQLRGSLVASGATWPRVVGPVLGAEGRARGSLRGGRRAGAPTPTREPGRAILVRRTRPSIGHGYVASVLDAFHSRAISSLDVSDYLDVRFDRLDRLEQAVFR